MGTEGGPFFFPLFKWHTATTQLWNDFGIFPARLDVPPLHHIPDITLPTLHQMLGLSGYRGLAHHPTLTTPEPPLRTAPLPDPPTYATPNPSLLPDRPTPPMPINFVDGLGYTVNRNALSSGDSKDDWEGVEKIWGEGAGIECHGFSTTTKKPPNNKRRIPRYPGATNPECLKETP